MKRIFALIAFLSLFVSSNSYADAALDKFLAEDRVPLGSPVKLGEWNGDLDACKKLADETGIPMIAVWSQSGCGHCAILERAMSSDRFREWCKKSGLILCFTCSLDPKAARQSGEYYYFCKRPNNITSYPFVRFYWYKDGGKTKVVDYSVHGDKVDKQQGIYKGSYDRAGQTVIDYILNTSGFGAYEPRDLATYNGGLVNIEETDTNRLEIDGKTANITVELVRDEKSAEIATNNLVVLVGSDGKDFSTNVVEWTAGQTNQNVTVTVENLGMTTNGQQSYLVVKDLEGTAQGTNTITYVDVPNSVANPLWIGERAAEAPIGRAGDVVPVLDWGEWTMDFNVATQKVAKADGAAYTLAAVLGSLWCHDCANTERNFFNVTNEFGKNCLAEWAKSNNVALVAIDIPNFETNSIVCSSPSLLSKKAFETTLALEGKYQYGRDEVEFYDVSLGGAPIELTKPVLRSGLGYLTRKGASDDEASAILDRNRILVQTDTKKGGFHRPSDSNQNRTGAPIFVLLRKDGSVAARLTTFASKSPMSADGEKISDILKRFDEMLLIADQSGEYADNIENDYPGDESIPLIANGGKAVGEISHADNTDVFKLVGVAGNAFQKVTVKGESDVPVTVEFCTLKDEKKEVVASVSNVKLSDGVSLEYVFTEANTYYVSVTGDKMSDAMSVSSTTANNFNSFTIDSDIVLVPQEVSTSAVAPEGKNTVVMRFEAGKNYRITGLDIAKLPEGLAKRNPDDETPNDFTAETTGDLELTLLNEGGTVGYQIWNPGEVGFVRNASEVNEDTAGNVVIPLVRKNGLSGDVKIKVSLDEENTNLYYPEAEGSEPRFEFDPVEISWPEGEAFTTNIVVGIINDSTFDGKGQVCFKIELVGGDEYPATINQSTYKLTVVDKDVQTAGKVAFVGADPFYSKKATVYVREGEDAKIYAERLTGSDGAVSVEVKLNSDDVSLGGDVNEWRVAWGNRERTIRKTIVVSGVAVGKTATLTMVKPDGGVAINSYSNSVRVVGVAANAPEFTSAVNSATLYRYVASSNSYSVIVKGGVDFTKMTFSKLMGTLPAGLKISWDKEANAMVVSGTVSAKAGVYESVYQVVLVNGSMRIPGLTMKLVYTVRDLAAENAALEAESQSPVFGKSRTLKDIAVIDTVGKRLVGTVTVTLPANGKGSVSAKYRSQAGDISFSAKQWTMYREDEGLMAELVSRKKDYAMSLYNRLDGSVSILLKDPNVNNILVAQCDGTIWSDSNPADAWKGSYTVALKPFSVDGAYAPAGYGSLTLKMEERRTRGKLWCTGVVKWAGRMANGMKVSGSTVIANGSDEVCNAALPVFMRSSADVISLPMTINADVLENLEVINTCQAVSGSSAAVAFWSHTDKKDQLSYEIEYDIFGSIFSENLDLVKQFSSEPALESVDAMSAKLSFETMTDNAQVLIQSNNIVLDSAVDNPLSVKLSFDKRTGVVKGSFKVKLDDGKVKTATYEGVVVPGWSAADCGCGEGDSPVLQLPFVIGSYWYSGIIEIDSKKYTVVHGGSLEIK